MEELVHIDEEPQIQGPALIPIGAHAKQPTVPLYRMTVIGSHESMHLRLVSPQISRAHVVILNCDGGVFLHDLNSRDGVFVNGRQTTEAELQEGDIVRVGVFSFRLAMNDGPHHHRVRRKPRPVHLERENGEVIALDRRVLVIGQRRGCGLRLKDAMVATVHAVILHANGRHYIRDLGSHNGTLVNDRRIRHTKLRPGDVIQIAKHTFRYARVDAPRPATTPQVAGLADALSDSALFVATSTATPPAESRFFAEEPIVSPATSAEPPAIMREPILMELPAVADALEVVEAVAEPAVEAAAEQPQPAVDDPVPAAPEIASPDPIDVAAVVACVDPQPFAIDAVLMSGAGVDVEPGSISPPAEPERMEVKPCGEGEPSAGAPEVVELPELAGLEWNTPELSEAMPEPMLLLGTAMVHSPAPDEADGAWSSASMAMSAPELVVTQPRIDEELPENALELAEWPALSGTQVTPTAEPPAAPVDEPMDAALSDWRPVAVDDTEPGDIAGEAQWPVAMDLPAPELVSAGCGAAWGMEEGQDAVEMPELGQFEIAPEPSAAPADEPADVVLPDWRPVAMDVADLASAASGPLPAAPEVVSAGCGAAWGMEDGQDAVEMPELGQFQLTLEPLAVESVPAAEAAPAKPEVVPAPLEVSSIVFTADRQGEALAEPAAPDDRGSTGAFQTQSPSLDVGRDPAPEAAPAEPQVASKPPAVLSLPAAEAAPARSIVEERPEVSQIIALAFTGAKLRAKPAARPAAPEPPAPHRRWMVVAIVLAVVLVAVGAAGIWLLLRGWV